MNIKKIEIPIYKIDVTIVLYSKPGQLKKKYNLPELYPTIEMENYGGGVFKDKDKNLVLAILTENGTAEPGLIAHEAKHMVNEIFTHIGHELCRYNDEPECYLLQYIVEQIHEFLNSKK